MSATTENSTGLYGESTDIDYLLMDVLVFVVVFRFVFSLSGFFIPFFTFCYRFHCGFSVFVAYCTVHEASCIVFDIHSYD